MTKPSPGQLKFITLTLNVQIKDVGVNLKVHVRGLRKHRIAKVQGRKGDFAKTGGLQPNVPANFSFCENKLDGMGLDINLLN